MRWGLVPRWWRQPLKELRVATFNARAEIVEIKPVFRDAFKRTRCLIPAGLRLFRVVEYRRGKAAVVFHPRDGSPLRDFGTNGKIE